MKHLIANTKHTIIQKSNRLYCLDCKSNFSCTDPVCKHWLQASCIKQGSTAAILTTHKPIKVNESLHRGNSNTHVTHDLYSYRGLVYCTKCGNRAGSSQFRHLARPCTTMGDYGSQVIKCITNNKLPTGVTIWPEEDLSSSGPPNT